MHARNLGHTRLHIPRRAGYHRLCAHAAWPIGSHKALGFTCDLAARVLGPACNRGRHVSLIPRPRTYPMPLRTTYPQAIHESHLEIP